MALTGLTNLQPLHIKTVGIGTFDNAVSIGGTLTYEDVTNVDAIGIITARSGVNVSGGQLDVGSNIKLGNAGVITATSFVGSGSGLTGLSAGLFAQTDVGIHTISKVGIGTTNPNKQLQVFDSSATSTTARDNTVARFISNASNADCNIQISNGIDHSAQIGVNGNGAEVYIAQDGNERLRINAEGQIKKVQDPVNRTSLKTYSGEGLWFDHYQLQSGGTYQRYADIVSVGDGSWGSNMRFFTMPNSGSPAERLRINSTGQVLIGETSVSGGTQKLVIGNGGNENFEFSPAMTSNNLNGGLIEYLHRNDGNTRPDLNLYTGGAGAIKFYTNGNESLRITSSGHISMRRSVTPLSGTGNVFSFNLYRDSGTGYGYIDAVTNSSNTAGVKIRGYSNTVYTNAFDHYAGVTKLAAGTIADRITLGSREITIKTTSYPETTEYLAVFNAGVANSNRFKNRYIKIRNNYTGSVQGGVPIVWESNADGSNNKAYGAIVTEGNGDIRFLNAAATSEKAIGTDLLNTISEKLRITNTGQLFIGTTSGSEILCIKRDDATGPTITLENNANKTYINNWGATGGGSGRTNRFEINATLAAQASIGAPFITFMTGGVQDANERVRIMPSGTLKALYHATSRNGIVQINQVTSETRYSGSPSGVDLITGSTFTPKTSAPRFLIMIFCPVNTSDDSDAGGGNTNFYFYGRIEYRKNGGSWLECNNQGSTSEQGGYAAHVELSPNRTGSNASTDYWSGNRYRTESKTATILATNVGDCGASGNVQFKLRCYSYSGNFIQIGQPHGNGTDDNYGVQPWGFTVFELAPDSNSYTAY